MSTQNKETGFNTKWRPAMGWLYLAVCAFDFVIFPILWNFAQATYLKTVVFTWCWFLSYCNGCCIRCNSIW
jgi:hypothetical protein